LNRLPRRSFRDVASMFWYNFGMSPEEVRVEELITKIRALPAERRAEVERFVVRLSEPADDRDVVRSMGRLAESAFARVWDNPADAAYDGV